MFNKKLKFFLNNTYLIFTLYIIILILLNIIFCKIYLIKNNYLINSEGVFLINKISNGFGPIIDMINKGQIPYLTLNEIKLYTARNIFLPVYLFILNKITFNNFLFLHLIKNISFGIIIFFIIKNLNNKFNNLFLITSLFLIYYLPFNNLVTFGIEKEEGLLNYLIIILFLLLIGNLKHKSIFLSITLALIFFLKSSMFLLTLIIPIFYLKEEKKLKYLPIITVVISNLIWGVYAYNMSGFFAFASKNSSNNAIAFYMMSTKEFNKSYPDITPDVYNYRVIEKIQKENIKNEKELITKLNQSNIKFLKEQTNDYFFGIIKKLYVLMLNPFKDAQWPNNIQPEERYNYYIHKSYNPVRLSNIFNKLIFNLSILSLFYYFFLNKDKNQFIKKINYYYLLIVFLYFPSYILGWMYDRHAVVIYIIAHLYLLLLISEKIFLKKY